MLPALAVADALRARGVEVTFAGAPGRAEARLVPEHGYELDTFRVSGFERRPSAKLARALAQAVGAPLACRRILDRRRPDVVLGGGGYVAGPMVLAAWTKRIPAALTEADAHLGLANKLAAPFARRVFTAYPLGLGDKERVVGRPVPRKAPVVRDDARRRFGLPDGERVVLVFGGSQGARALNEMIARAWGESGPVVLHLTGERDYESVRARSMRPGYVVRAFVDDFEAALAAADVAVARAGGSVWELAAAGVPAVLVPYPHATADHQRKNADHFVRAGGAVVVDEKELESVPETVRALLSDDERLASMSDAMRRAARPDAAEEIAEELIALARAARR
ncbi:MAG TPA: undecaprenyldiphospho-muramoylpentapeptide beta-N-acetylglucosaminyltransferase [Gaiellaceae bacterium]|nr:undecaprenyldiphospho-muramoylpentapeptide beta-N-acetylglucosaminyltransferase [Gaiellaceae bacterium]